MCQWNINFNFFLCHDLYCILPNHSNPKPLPCYFEIIYIQTGQFSWNVNSSLDFIGFHGFHWISWITWICLYFIILYKDYMFHNSLGIFIGEENPWNPQQLSPNNFNDSTAWTCCTQNVYMYICCTIQSPTINIISGSCTHLPQCLCSTA